MKIGRRLSPKDDGFRETVEKYAYCPKFMTNGDLVWFEKYTETRVWQHHPANIWTTVTYWGWNIVNRERKN